MCSNEMSGTPAALALSAARSRPVVGDPGRGLHDTPSPRDPWAPRHPTAQHPASVQQDSQQPVLGPPSNAESRANPTDENSRDPPTHSSSNKPPKHVSAASLNLSKLVMEHVIESMYSRQRSQPWPEKCSETVPTSANPSLERVSAAATTLPNSASVDARPLTSTASPAQTVPQTVSQAAASETVSETVCERKNKVAMTFGEIQETLIRQAVENSYDLGLSGWSDRSHDNQSTTKMEVAEDDKENLQICKQNTKLGAKLMAEKGQYSNSGASNITLGPTKFESCGDTKHSPQAGKINERADSLSDKLTQCEISQPPSNTTVEPIHEDLASSTDSGQEHTDGDLRKSKRSNRGRRYRELIDQGYLQSVRDKGATEAAVPPPAWPVTSQGPAASQGPTTSQGPATLGAGSTAAALSRTAPLDLHIGLPSSVCASSHSQPLPPTKDLPHHTDTGIR